MASKTPNLRLNLPGNNEFRDIWDQPLADNWNIIDDEIADVQSEIVAARGSESTLADRLDAGLEDDGSPKPTTDVLAARSSKLYGHRLPPPSGVLAGLPFRLDSSDSEIRSAREASASLRAALAYKSTVTLGGKMILDGSKDVNGYPSWLANASTTITVDGDPPNPVMLLIDGYLGRVRNESQLDFNGQGAGTWYLYADYVPDGVIIVDGDSATPPPASPTGAVTTDANSDLNVFDDSAVNFVIAGVQPGDILEVLSSTHEGIYEVQDVGYDSNPNQIRIVGLFNGELPTGSIRYNIYDPLGVELGFSSSAPTTDGRVYIGEADTDSSSTVTAIRPYHFKDTFVGEWRSVDISTPAIFTEHWSHNLGTDILDVSIQVSAANDGSAPVEELSLGKIESTLAFNQGTLPTHAADVWNPGTSNASFTSGAFAPGTLPTLTGTVLNKRSVLAQWTKNLISVKNIHNTIFYEDFSGATQTTGFIRVIVRKRG